MSAGASPAACLEFPCESFHPGRIRIEGLHGQLRREFVESQGWLPLEETEEGLVVMCLDPEAVRRSRLVPMVFQHHTRFAWRVASPEVFARTVGQLYGTDDGESIDALSADLQIPLEDDAQVLAESSALDNELVKFVNKMVVDAYHQRASDIHIEPMPGRCKTGIRFRIDGVLRHYLEVSAHLRQALVTRLKIMCDLDISERRRPQDGKIAFRRFGPLDIELRVATVPTAGGVEDVVIRLLAAGEPMPLEQLDLSPDHLARLKAVVSQPHGLFYVCGPTGSGKTTTLHSVLRLLDTPEHKIWTAEDPVEITQKGLRQVQVHRKAGLDFPALMRAFLRADPDIIMVGESRDRETVAMGVEASLTGHLVLSTLHTNSAPESIVRLLDMGMDPFNFSDALLGVLAQRLARRLCDCKQPRRVEADEARALLAEYTQALRQTAAWQADPQGQARRLYDGWLEQWGADGHLRLWRPVGCERCHATGWRGRVALHELLVVDDGLRRLIQQRAPIPQLQAAALEAGMRTLRMDGMEKALQGLTDLHQVRSVCVR